MTYATAEPSSFTRFERGRPVARLLKTVFGAAAVTSVGVTGAWMLTARPLPAPAPLQTPRPAAAPAPAAARLRSVLLDPMTAADVQPFSLAWNAPPATAFEPSASPEPILEPASPVLVAPPELKPELLPVTLGPAEAPAPTPQRIPAPVKPLPQIVANVPLPTPRPPKAGTWADADRGLSRPHRPFAQNRVATASTPAPDNRSFFEKIFGVQRPSGPALGYAAAEDDVFGKSKPLMATASLPTDRSTAVYVIAAHTVYMPNGTTLEAHSGLGQLLDDPRSFDKHDRGVTPPHVYDLSLREQPFHGVRALRLNPVGGGGIFGRNGLLAHTYMLGPNGDSNGCVSFRNYDAFLQAYMNGEVKRLAVVPRPI